MEIPNRYWQRWDGGYKDFTKNCSECDYHREIKDKQLCGWGIAFKYLVKPKKTLRKCYLLRSEKTKCPSIKYLDEIVVAEDG